MNEKEITRRREEWLTSMSDPFCEELFEAGEGLPEAVALCALHLREEPAFDPRLIENIGENIELPSARFDRPIVERVVPVGLAHIEATFVGDEPRYGTDKYAESRHASFPPAIITLVDALTIWRMTAKAGRLFSYWLYHFLRSDGSIDYYGPCLSEYGQLLTTARRLVERGADQSWLSEHSSRLSLLASFLRERINEGGSVRLARGVPEADEHKQVEACFHNNAWLVRGIHDWAYLLEHFLCRRKEAESLRREADVLLGELLRVVDDVWSKDPSDWWLQPTLEPVPRPPERITSNRISSYTNYRYYPEVLSSGVLPREKMERIVRARLTGGGQFIAMTRFVERLDDLPLMEYLEGLWKLALYRDYKISLWGHIYYHQAEGHLTAYEQVTLPPGRKVADFCLPSQSVAIRAPPRLVMR